MSEISIPVALDPNGNPVPIEEAVRYKNDYYRCPECEEIVNPRKGAKRAHYYAHKPGVLEDKSCSLSSQADVDEMVDELRTTDIEKGEQNRDIRLYLGEKQGRLRLFGVLPSLEWESINATTDIGQVLDQVTIETKGVENPPVPENFHPSEPEVVFDLDPSAEEYLVDITSNTSLDQLEGTWRASSLEEGDLFLGDQGRARRHRENRQVKRGEWVYLLAETPPHDPPESCSTFSLATYSVLGFPAREETESLLDEYDTSLTTDQFGFDADVVLPPTAHPTSEAPIEAAPAEPVLVGVRPADEIDPIFEVVSIPKREGDTVEIEPTGPGNPRYYTTAVPKEGSRRTSIHQRNSARHRLVHLHATPDSELFLGESGGLTPTVGYRIEAGADPVVITPLGAQDGFTFGGDFNPVSLPSVVEYTGPTGLELEMVARFSADSPHNAVVRRQTRDPETLLPQIGQWATEGCEVVRFYFDGVGAVHFVFSDDSAATGPMQTTESTSEVSTK